MQDDFNETFENDNEVYSDEEFTIKAPTRKPRSKKPISPKPVKNGRKIEFMSRKSCYYCDQTFPTRSSLSDHVKTSHVDKDGKLQCRDCDLSCANIKAMRKHIYLKHSSVKCEECNKSYTKNVYAKHIQTVHADKSSRKFKCDQCSFTSYAMKYIYDHKSAAHDNKDKPKCLSCHETFPNQMQFQDHRCDTKADDIQSQESVESDIIQCPECQVEVTKRGLIRHFSR